MKLPKEQEEVLVKLDNGKFTVALYNGKKWVAGEGVWPSEDNGNQILSGKVISWSKLPTELENNLEEKKNKPRM